MKKKKQNTTKAKSAEFLAREQHRAVAKFLRQEPLYSKLLDSIPKSTELRLLTGLLNSDRPVLSKKIAEKASVEQGAISPATIRLNGYLRDFLQQNLEELKARHITFEIPRRARGGYFFGYYLACYDYDSKEYLNAAETIELLEQISKDEVELILMKKLQAEASQFLAEKLNGRNDYQPLEMEVGVIEERLHLSETEEVIQPSRLKTYDYSRRWIAFESKLLLSPKENYILSSDVGTGKTTFLRHLQLDILKEGKLLPIFLHATDIESWKFKDTDKFILKLAGELRAWISEEKAIEFLNKTFSSKILLLVDGLDQISGEGTGYQLVLDKLLRICNGNLILASRPSAVISQEMNPNVTFLRLKAFSKDKQEEYFGQHYRRACELCERDRAILGIPMLAYMVRELTENGGDKNITNRASLYKRFIDYVLKEYKHEESKLTEGERAHIRKLLQEISYKALADKESFVQKIPLRNCCQFINEYEKIDRLPKYGLVNLIVDACDGIEKYLYFTHQSFQEYLAAEWSSKSEERVKYLVENYWNPKLKEVIKFLCGMNGGEDIIQRIYHGPKYDNVIHSRLFFVTECIDRSTEDSIQRDRLLSELQTIDYPDILDASIIQACGELATEQAKKVAWDRVVGLIKADWPSHPIFFSRQLFEHLLSEDRVSYLVNILDGVLAESAMHILTLLSSKLSDEILDTVISKYDKVESLNISQAAYRLLVSQKQYLTIEQVRRLIKIPYSKSIRVSDIVGELGSRLNKKQIMKLLKEIKNDKWPHDVIRALFGCYLHKQDLLNYLETSHLDYIWNLIMENEEILSGFYIECPSIIRYFNDRQRDLLFEKLKNLEPFLKHTLLWLFSKCADLLNMKQIETIVPYLEIPETDEYAIYVLTGGYGQLSENDRNRVIKWLIEKRNFRTRTVLNAGRCIRANISVGVQRKLCEGIKNFHLYKYDIIESLSYWSDVLDTELLWEVLKGVMDKNNEFGLSHKIWRPHCLKAFAPYLRYEQRKYVLFELERATRRKKIVLLLDLIDAHKIDSDDVKLICRLLNHESYYVRSRAYKKLIECHKEGKI